MSSGEHVIGVLNAESAEPNAFDQDDERLLVTMAGQLASAVERLRTESARRAVEGRLVSLMDMAVDAIISLDIDQRIIRFNQGAEVTFGYCADEILGQPLDVLLPENAVMVHHQHILNFADAPATARQMAERKIVYGRRRDGTKFPAEASISKLEQGNEIIFTVILRDITERAQHEREREALLAVASALRLSRTRAEMLPIILDQLMTLLNADGTSFAVPDMAANEVSVELGRGVWAHAAGVSFPLDLGVSDGVVEAGQSDVINDLQTHPNFPRFHLLQGLEAVAGAPLMVQGQLIGSLWVGRKFAITDAERHLLTAVADMAANAIHRVTLYEKTQRHAAELEQRVAERTLELAEAIERLKELDTLKTKLVSDVSHELRTPVTILKLHLDLLKHGKQEKRSQYLDVLNEQAARLGQLIEDILDLSRLEMGGHRVQFAPVKLNDLVEQVVDAHQVSAEDAGLLLTFAPADGLPPVTGERNQLAQVITNLIANAINYTSSGRVDVSTSLAEDRKQICLQVKDTGKGIVAVDLPHLFERFYRGTDVGQSDIPGTGLGLAIVKEIVALHEGQIDVESKEGEGTTFGIWLPYR